MNVLYYGDNLDILREYIPDESVDLIYLDPPFNSRRSYNVLFKEANGTAADSQIRAFDDTWSWGQTAEATLHEIVTTAQPHIVDMMQAMVSFVGRNDVSAYLVMMTIRLIELHRVLKPTGSIYLHCDPTASHYLKVVMDAVFGKMNFRNEIIWKRTSAHSDSTVFGSAHDIILYYSEGSDFVHNKQYQPYSDSYIKSHYRHVDKHGRRYRTDNLTAIGLSGGGYEYEWHGVTKIWRCPIERMRELDELGRVRYTRTGTAEYIRYLDEMPGVPAQDLWPDIPPINPQAKERLG
ncbi:MAG TPA: site-specific DNA-methyltransferase, partial [Anaerolineae bacterium]|nr:site-specific DNA-methyltransferase [Anaerolineae bacterium]